MYDFLLEILCEEIPAKMQQSGVDCIEKLILSQLESFGVTYKAALKYYTPRRLILDIRGLSAKSEDKVIEVKGPSINAPQAAIEGFMRKVKISDISQAKIINDPKKGDFYLFSQIIKARDIFEIMSEVLQNSLVKMSWPKSMRWSDINQRWVRPIKNILAILFNENDGTEVVKCNFANITANNKTQGHRFLSDNSWLEIKNFDDYVQKLTANFVTIDAKRRQDTIYDDAKNLCFASNCELVKDNHLLEEVANLVEYPVTYLGVFDTEFLKLPKRVIQTTIKENQKCFVTKKIENEDLQNYFVICSNIKTQDHGQIIIKGNEKVIKARLSDAYYFFNKDMQRPLKDYLPKLKNMQFYQSLGTQYDRIQRIDVLSKVLAQLRGYKSEQKLTEAALLCKCDLVSEMVGEFANLQGYMGHQYALAQGVDCEVAQAIEDHYKPQGLHDSLPKSELGLILALADKIDMLTGFFAIGQKPTGSSDPFALRRAGFGVVRLILAKDINFDLIKVIEKAQKAFNANVKDEVYEFILERFKSYLRDNDARYDVVNAVVSSQAQTGDLLYMARLIESLIYFLDQKQGDDFLRSIKRIYNIVDLNKEKQTGENSQKEFNKEIEDSPYALELFSKIEQLGELKNRDDLEKLAKISPIIEQFFDNVMVNHENLEIRENRLNLLNILLFKVEKFVDFCQIVTK